MTTININRLNIIKIKIQIVIIEIRVKKWSNFVQKTGQDYCVP